MDAPHIPGVLLKGLVDPNLNVAQYVFVYVYIYIHIQIDAILCMVILFQLISFHLENGSKCTDPPLVGVFKTVTVCSLTLAGGEVVSVLIRYHISFKFDFSLFPRKEEQELVRN